MLGRTLLLAFVLMKSSMVRPRYLAEDPFLVEGDIVADEKILDLMGFRSQRPRITKRDAVKQAVLRWQRGVIPYIVSPEMNQEGRKAIKEAIAELQKKTCLRFRQRIMQTDYVVFISGYGCYSSVGKQGGQQVISLGNGCHTKAQALHEIMHTLGFFHEQSRFDRDLYVKILWWNIMPGALKNFGTYGHGKLDTLGAPYDMNSIMHYHNKDFSKNGGNTIEAIDDPKRVLGKDDLSKIDIKQINQLYDCDKKRSAPICKDRVAQCRRIKAATKLCKHWPVVIMKRLCPVSCNLC